MENLTYKVEKKTSCLITLDIEVHRKKIDIEFEKIYGEIKKEIRISGFRKGKVPINLIKERHKEEAKQKLVNKLLPDVLGDVLEKENINPAITPKITDYSLENNKPLKFKVEVEIYPEVQVKKYKKIKLEKKGNSVKEKDVKNTIQAFRERNAVIKAKDGSASNGDFVVISSKVFIDSKEVNSVLPENSFIEIGGNFHLSEFDKNIKGMKKGEIKEFDYNFPDDFPEDELKGRLAHFNVKVKEIKEKKFPEEQEIAESLGFDTVDKLNDNIRENLKNQMEKTSEDELKNQIIEYLITRHDFEVPEGLVEENLQRDKKQTAEYIEKQGGDPAKIDETKIREKVIREIKAGLLLSSIARQESIEVTDIDRKEEEKKILKFLGEDNRERARKYIDDNVILAKKIFDFIKENAKIKTNKD